jgi:hypothetical protein
MTVNAPITKIETSAQAPAIALTFQSVPVGSKTTAGVDLGRIIMISPAAASA